MATLFHDEEEAKQQQKVYMDRKYFSSYDQQIAALRGSKWVYVGNTSFHTSEVQMHALFSQAGRVQRVIMGLNRCSGGVCRSGSVAG